MKRILGIIALIAGVAIVVGTFVISVAQQKETNVKLSVPAQSAVFTTTAPGVLTVVNSDVVVTLQSPGNDVQWALGTPGDVEAFVGQAPAQTIVGLKSWQALDVTSSAGTAEGSDEVAQEITNETFGLLGSDMWADEDHDANSVTVELDAKSIDNKVLIATTAQGQAPEVTLQWVRVRDIANPVVFYVIGILLALIGTFLLLNWYQEQLALRSMAHKSSVKLRSRGCHQPTTELIAFDGDLAAPTTEREIQRVHTAAGLGATVLPGSARSAEFRDRPLDPQDRIVLRHAGETEDSLGEESTDSPESRTYTSEHNTTSTQASNSDKDWRSLWNFSWGPAQKEEGKHA